ncbi:MAG: ELM1/GtrOC1 family putative glycosyltransferase [Gammaproteobacteria bacterium]|nr:ELM1/GtrOC1 family putative glycosyltransferase [Gammaproteobacteria bacterium]
MVNPLVIWYFTDGKLGHENQVKGLIQAIANHTDVISHKIPIPHSRMRFLIDILSGNFFRTLSKLSQPSYLIAAGNRTHIAMLIATHYFGGKSILLMRSNWPLRWFDMAIIPEHDTPSPGENILTTQGVLNTIQPSKNHLPAHGLILAGGPSKHFHWDSEKIIQQIQNIVKTHSDIKWTIANSRRTPADFFDKLHTLSDTVSFVEHTHTSAHWLPDQLAQSTYVWVSPDSVSMLYEAVTSGSAVGCLELNKKCNNRIVNGVEKLISQGMVSSYQQWQTTHSLHVPSHQLNEAQRAADWILAQ